MKKLLLSTLAATALLSGVAHAGDYYRSGAWANYYNTGDSGVPLCGMYVTGTDRSVHVKFSRGKLFVVLFKNTWSIPSDTPIEVEIGFDDKSWGHVTNAYGGNDKRIRGLVSVGIADNSVANFLEHFAEADKMWFRFGGNEAGWSAKMEGSRNAAGAFAACVARIGNSVPTQPYTSQPKQAPTQPFEPASRKPVFSGKDREA